MPALGVATFRSRGSTSKDSRTSNSTGTSSEKKQAPWITQLNWQRRSRSGFSFPWACGSSWHSRTPPADPALTAVSRPVRTFHIYQHPFWFAGTRPCCEGKMDLLFHPRGSNKWPRFMPWAAPRFCCCSQRILKNSRATFLMSPLSSTGEHCAFI